ncbi:MAG TPA: glycosyltransferase family 2 protein [Acidobacteriaceae bacterium]|jgi:hypothetical protein|nr:glycosyltransferase family 2 protein [Acidobacteriaceae bacterium]
MSNITASIVLYRHKFEEIADLLERLSTDRCVKCWVVVDNGSSKDIRSKVEALGGIYIDSGENLGFGRGHNLAICHLKGPAATYHLILNPDITLADSVLGKLTDVMDAKPDVGLVMPKILYPDGSNQYLCKLLPAPIDLVLRRFAPRILKRVARNRIESYELRNFDYETPAYVPSLSGCFMFARRSALDAIGGFDERFFLYMEDVDLCRRISEVSKLLYWPDVKITHIHQMGSYKNLRVLWLHIRAAVSYFNKWGWFVDPQRTEINRHTLASLAIKEP